MQDYIILDYDGTIHDTMRIYKKAFLKAYEWLVQEGKAVRREFDDSQISRWLGFNSKEMWNTFMPTLEEEYKTKASGMIGEFMVQQVIQGGASLYDGAEKVLEELKRDGNRLIFLSNCKEAYEMCTVVFLVWIGFLTIFTAVKRMILFPKGISFRIS